MIVTINVLNVSSIFSKFFELDPSVISERDLQKLFYRLKDCFAKTYAKIRI